MNLVESKWKRCKSKRVYLGLSQGFEWQSEPMGAATNSGLLLTIRLPSPGLILLWLCQFRLWETLACVTSPRCCFLAVL